MKNLISLLILLIINISVGTSAFAYYNIDISSRTINGLSIIGSTPDQITDVLGRPRNFNMKVSSLSTTTSYYLNYGVWKKSGFCSFLLPQYEDTLQKCYMIHIPMNSIESPLAYVTIDGEYIAPRTKSKQMKELFKGYNLVENQGSLSATINSYTVIMEFDPLQYLETIIICDNKYLSNLNGSFLSLSPNEIQKDKEEHEEYALKSRQKVLLIILGGLSLWGICGLLLSMA